MLKNYVKEVVSLFTGQKSAVPHPTLAPTDAEKIVNFVCRQGALQKIWGGTLYATITDGLGAIKWISRFNDRWIVQRGDSISLESADGSASFSEIGTMTGGSSGRVSSDRWRNRIFMVNGTVNKFYEDSPFAGEKFLNLGITPPGNGARGISVSQPALTISQIAGFGTLTSTRVYSYMITWYDSVRGIESFPNGSTVGEDGRWIAPSDGTEITISAPNNTAVINNALIKANGYDSDRVTHWIIYRAVVTSGVTGDFKRVPVAGESSLGTGIVSIATEEVLDGEGTEANRGALLNVDNSPPPSGQNYIEAGTSALYGPKFVKFFRDQLWLFGTDYSGITAAANEFNPVSGVAYASDVQNFDYWLYTFDVGRSNGQKDTGMGIHQNILMFFKERSIYALDGTNPDNYVMRTLDTRRGCVAPGSIQETPIGVIGLSAEGFFQVTGSGPSQLISQEIFDEIRKINFAYRDKIVSAYDNQEGKYECHVPILPSIENVQVFSFDVNFRTWQILDKKVGQACHYDINSQKSRIGLLGDAVNGRLYDVVDEDAPAFNNQAILAHWHSKQFDFGSSDLLKRLVRVVITAECKTDFSIDVDVILDFGKETITFTGLTSASGYSTWADGPNDQDGMTWDQDNWAGASVKTDIELSCSGIARNFQIVIRESTNSANTTGFKITEIVLEANRLRR